MIWMKNTSCNQKWKVLFKFLGKKVKETDSSNKNHHLWFKTCFGLENKDYLT